jgi:hypothetical protein
MDKDIIVRLLLQAQLFNQGAGQATTAVTVLRQEVAKTDSAIKGLEGTTLKSAAGTKALGVSAVKAAGDNKLLDTILKQLAGSLKEVNTHSGNAAHGVTSLHDIMHLAAGAAEGMAGALAVERLVEFAEGAVNATEKINQLRIATAAIVASNETVTDSSGKVVGGIEKIIAAQQQTSGVFNQLQLDAIKTTDTTQGLIEKFEAMSAAGLSMGLSLEQLRKLTLSFSATTSALGITGQQARTEIKDLFEGVRLGQSQLAIGLKIKEEDIKKAKEQGRLYEFLTDKTKDFVAANQLQARTLTGAKSSLIDFMEILERIAGEHATEVLTSGFLELLDSIVKTDGTLTPLGEDLEQMGRTGGEVLAALSGVFIDMVNMFVHGGATIATILTDSLVAIRSVAAEMGANSAVFGPQHQNTADIHNLEDKLSRPSFLPGGMSERERGDALLELATKKHQAKVYEQNQGPMTKAADAAASGQQNEDVRRLMGEKTFDAKVPKYNYKADAARKEKEKKGSHKADPQTKVDDANIQRIMRDMEHELHLSDLTEKVDGLTRSNAPIENDDRKLSQDGKSGIIAKRRAELEALMVTEGAAAKKREAIETVDRKIEDQRVERTLDQAKATKEATDKQEALNVAIEEGKAKNDDASAARELEHTKATNKAQLDALQTRFAGGEIKAKEYFENLAELRTKDLDADMADERRKLLNQRAVEEEKFKKATGQKGKYYDPAKVEAALQSITGIDSALAAQSGQRAEKLSVIRADSKKGTEEDIAKHTEAGLKSAIDSVFSGSLDPIRGVFEASAKDGILKALQSGDLGEAAKNLFTSSEAGMIGGVLSMMAQLPGLVQGYINGVKDKQVKAEDVSFGFDNPVAGTPANVRHAADKNAQAQRDAFMEGNKGVFGDLTGAYLTKQQESQVNTEHDRSIAAGDASYFDGNAKQAFGILKAARDNGEIDYTKLIAYAKELLATTTMNSDTRKAMIKELAGFEIAKTSEVIDAKKSLEQEGAKAIEATWRDSVAATDRAQQASIDAWVVNLQKLKAAQDAAAKSMADAFTISEGKNVSSKAQDDIRKANADEAAARLLRQGYYDQSNAVNGTLGQLNKYVGTRGNGPLTVTMDPSAIQNGVTDPNVQTLMGGRAIMQTGVSNGANMASDLKSLMDILATGKIHITLGDQHLTVADLQKAATDATNAPALQAAANAGILSSNQAILAAQSAGGLGQAAIDKATRETLAPVGQSTNGLDHEIAAARAFGNQGAERQLKLADVDAYIAQKRVDLHQSGVLKDGTLTPDDQASQDKVNSGLTTLADLLKQQVDKEYSTANPLPVLVVNPPALFALPDSAYFRAKQTSSVNITLAPGAVRIDGSGLTEAQQTAAIQNALVMAAPEMAAAVNAQNTVNNNRMTLPGV